MRAQGAASRPTKFVAQRYAVHATTVNSFVIVEADFTRYKNSAAYFFWAINDGCSRGSPRFHTSAVIGIGGLPSRIEESR
jgi:hypothetical protein